MQHFQLKDAVDKRSGQDEREEAAVAAVLELMPWAPSSLAEALLALENNRTVAFVRATRAELVHAATKAQKEACSQARGR